MPTASTEIEPCDLGLPSRFVEWRPGQLPAFYRAIASDKRFIAGCLPTGTGKSLFGCAIARAMGVRACILTSTKLLQSQYIDDFGESGMVDIRGRHNYDCPIAKGATCADGPLLGCKSMTCPRKQAHSSALQSDLVVSNYPCYLHLSANGEGLGEFGLLILDEAHSVVDELCSFLEISFTPAEFEPIYRIPGITHPEETTIPGWRKWAAATLGPAKSYFDGLRENASTLDVLRHAKKFHELVGRIKTIGDDWILDTSSHTRNNFTTYKFSPLWPNSVAESLLYRGVKKVLFLSATIVEKSTDMIGVHASDCLFINQNSTFDPNRSPCYLFGPSRIDHRASEGQLAEWVARMDLLISRRQDRKGIIHTVSYDRQKDIVNRSRFSPDILSPSSFALPGAVAAFRQSSPPRLIASPALTTGYNFPGSQCEYQIISKVPFIDSRGKLMQIRSRSDPEYLPYLTAQTLVQICGRAMRGFEDQCENFILDQHANWFIKRYRHLFPSWFLLQIRYPDGPPTPPQALMLV